MAKNLASKTTNLELQTIVRGQKVQRQHNILIMFVVFVTNLGEMLIVD